MKYILINVKKPIKTSKYATTRNIFLHFKLDFNIYFINISGCFKMLMKYTLIDVKKHLKLREYQSIFKGLPFK